MMIVQVVSGGRGTHGGVDVLAQNWRELRQPVFAGYLHGPYAFRSVSAILTQWHGYRGVV